MTRRPFRSPRAPTTRTDDTLAAALADLAAARAHADALRRLVAEGDEGAASSASADCDLRTTTGRRMNTPNGPGGTNLWGPTIRANPALRPFLSPADF
ncbi:MAG: hypothetical protein M3524_01215 [Actinomycetota bacterium]|nr:hypothetical protein [Actinomycetota bacterium]